VNFVNEGTKPKGRIYAQVGQLLVQYEGEIEESLDKIRIFDIRSGQTIDLNRDAVKQIVWKIPPRIPPTTQASAAGGRV